MININEITNNEIVEMIKVIYQYGTDDDMKNVPLIKKMNLFDDDVENRAIHATELVYATAHDTFNIEDDYFRYYGTTGEYVTFTNENLQSFLNVEHVVKVFKKVASK